MDALETALGTYALRGKCFVYLLSWNGARGKFDKSPIGSPAAASMTYAAARAEALRLRTQSQQATVGLWLDEGCGLYFLDIDGLPDDYKLDARAERLLAMFPGAFVEWSVGKRGLHVVGRLAESVAHSCRNDALHLELYTGQRGIALNIDGTPCGSMDAVHSISALVREHFPPRFLPQLSGALPALAGATDDDVLIGRMLSARLSAAAAFGAKASFADLWEGKAEKNSHNDAALASHLAFWTGRDLQRMARLMWRSGMVRDKWTTHRTYLDITIASAISKCGATYQERGSAPPQLVMPNVRSGTVLMGRTFAPINWALRGITPQGTQILSAPPKSGKSWLVLQACMAVAAGVPLWPGREPETPGEVLYLDLEGSDRRLKERIGGLLKAFPPGLSLDKFYYETEWARADAGVAMLRSWLSEHPSARLIVIDTLATFREPDPGRKSAYMADYSVGEMLKPLVREFPVAILLVTHTRKMAAGDAMDRISGTQGLVGGVDNYMILSRATGNMDAELVVNGRDIREPLELALRKLESGGWMSLGSAGDIKRSDERNDVLKALTSLGGVGTPRDIHAALQSSVSLATLYKRLGRMAGAGEIIRSGKFYTLLTVKDGPVGLPKLPGA